MVDDLLLKGESMSKFDEGIADVVKFAQESENNKKQALNALAFALAAIE